MRYVNIAVGTNDSFLMNKAVNTIRSMGYEVDYHYYNGSDLDEDPL